MKIYAPGLYEWVFADGCEWPTLKTLIPKKVREDDKD